MKITEIDGVRITEFDNGARIEEIITEVKEVAEPISALEQVKMDVGYLVLRDKGLI